MGIILGLQSELGRNTVLGGGHQNVFSVTFEVEDPDSINVAQVKRIIENRETGACWLYINGRAQRRPPLPRGANMKTIRFNNDSTAKDPTLPWAGD